MEWILEKKVETPTKVEYTFRRPLLPAIIAVIITAMMGIGICIV